jgi:hypothetical protein
MVRSVTDLAMAPMASNRDDSVQVPSTLTLPGVGLSAYRAALAAGCTSDPSVSVPNAKGLYPAETPTADPVDEPKGL